MPSFQGCQIGAGAAARRPSGRSVTRAWRIAAVFILCGWLLCQPALAAEGGAKGGSEAILLAQILALVFCGRLLGELMIKMGQPAVMGQLLAGILLGPSVLGVLWPGAEQAMFPKLPEQKAMIDGLAQFGILMLLLLAGMETDLSLVRRVRRAAVSASIGGITAPFACGFLTGWFLPESLLPDPNQRLITALFLGTALSISSVKIVATVVREMGFLRRNIGQVILASAIVDDTIGWIIIAMTLSLAAHGNFDWMSISESVFGTIAFLIFSFTIGRKIVFKLIRWTNDYLAGEAPEIATILVIMAAFALTTHLIGVHTVLGAFVAGILVGESPILTRQIDEQLRGLTAGLFMPVFFGLAGLSTDLTILKSAELVWLTAGIILIASIGKATGAFVGSWFGGLNRREAVALATGMNARGSTEIVVASIGLSMGVLNQTLFTMIVAMAVITTLAMPPTLRLALQRLPVREEERKRLDRETFETKAFVPTLERILVAVDDSPKGRFASRVAGLLAGARNMPVTVLNLAPADEAREMADGDTDRRASPAQVVTSAAGTIAPNEDEEAQGPIEVIERRAEAPSAEAVAAEARKGYDLLVIGVNPTVGAGGGFHDEVSRLARGFEGSLAIVVARGHHESDPEHSPMNILVPVTGSEVSRRGAEIAVVLAKAAKVPITALSVLAGNPGSIRDRFGAARRDAAEVVKEIKMLADFSEQSIRTAIRTDISPEDAILRQARMGKHDLIVLGVSRRPGETLSFGKVASALLDSAERSLLFVAPQVGANPPKGPPT